MYKYTVALLGLMAILSAPYSSSAQQAEAPVYRDGDWWRIKLDTVRPAGVSISGPQFGGFPEYIVKIEAGGPKVFGIRGEVSKELDAPPIVALVLGKTGWRGELIKFPVRVGLFWSDRFQLQPRGLLSRWEQGQYEVQAWEKIKTPKGEFEAFRIIMTMAVPTGPKSKGTSNRTTTYYYAPEVKAIVSFTEEGSETNVVSTLVEFNTGK
jgi:hypothetical protein